MYEATFCGFIYEKEIKGRCRLMFEFIGKLIGRLIEIVITNVATLLAFYFLYQFALEVSPTIQNYYKIPLFINIVFLIYQDIKILLGR